MTTVVEMPLADGTKVLVEVAEDGREPRRVGRSGDIMRHATETLEEALRRVKPAITTVFSEIRDLATPPDKIKVEFGVKLTADAGVVIARAGSEANFKLCLEWARQRGGD